MSEAPERPNIVWSAGEDRSPQAGFAAAPPAQGGSPVTRGAEVDRARFPRWVYGAGEEPDPRFSLANERTFLAWIRTSLALVAGGVVLEALAVPLETGLRLASSLLLIGLGILAPVQAWVGWSTTERSLRRSRPLPAPWLSPLIAAGALSAAVLLFLAVLLR